MNNRDNYFDIPIVLFTFKRKETVLQILSQIRKIKPSRLYLISDNGRNDEEKEIVLNVRKSIEEAIDWECNVVKYYAVENRGVYKNIGLGAKWVFEREDMAIFLEDDNYPEITFFEYCKEMLLKYKESDNILWVCGTNYLGKYVNKQRESYMFTQHLLPCGWASWASKFNKYYDGELNTFGNIRCRENFKNSYRINALYKQQLESVEQEFDRKQNGENFRSWDYQMIYSIRANNLFGISPCYNQIRNIGVDENSIHGGTSMNMVMTKRFCENPTYPIGFPLNHPNKIYVDIVYDKKISKIILFPLTLRFKGKLNIILKKIFNINKNASLTKELKNKFNFIKK